MATAKKTRKATRTTEPKTGPDADKADGLEKAHAILDAAMGLFAQRGFFGTPVEEIADTAGVGAGTVYRYFRSKDALVNALFQREKMRLAHALMNGFSRDKSTREQFHQMWHVMASYVAANVTAVAFLELHHHADYISVTSRAIEEKLLEPTLAFIKDAQLQNTIKNIDPQVISAMIYGAFMGLVKYGWQERVTLDEETLTVAENCIWEAIRR